MEYLNLEICSNIRMEWEYSNNRIFVDILILLLFNVPVNNFSVMLRQSHLFLSITSTFGE